MSNFKFLKTMNRQAILILILLTVTVVVYGQDTLYFDTNNKRLASLDSASSYRIYTTDKIREGNLIESVYSKSGKIKSSCSLLLQFTMNANKTMVEAYTSGKISWNDPRMEKQIESLKDGTYKEWYENEQLRKEIEYKEGKMKGHYISYWENGQIKREEYMGSDKSVEGKCFDQFGNVVKYTPIEQMPEFPGGEAMLFRFLANNVKYPIIMANQNIQGRVVAQFTVGKDGSLSDIKIIHSIHPAGDKEAIRIISLMPKWKPGILEDEPVLVTYTLPIVFNITNSDDIDLFETRNANGHF